jgi:hypothetical protein
MRTTLLITLILFTLSCKPTETNIIGTYKKHSNFEDWYTLRIKQNHEFAFRGQEGNIVIDAEGTWRLTGDTLILNSRSNEKPSRVDFSKTSPSHQLFINVIDSNGQPIEGVYVDLINSGISTQKTTDASGRATFPNNKYDSLDVGLIGYQRLITRLPLDGSNEFNIKLMPNYNTFYQLKNQMLKIRWRRLIADSLPSTRSKQIFRK